MLQESLRAFGGYCLCHVSHLGHMLPGVNGSCALGPPPLFRVFPGFTMFTRLYEVYKVFFKVQGFTNITSLSLLSNFFFFSPLKLNLFGSVKLANLRVAKG